MPQSLALFIYLHRSSAAYRIESYEILPELNHCLLKTKLLYRISLVSVFAKTAATSQGDTNVKPTNRAT